MQIILILLFAPLKNLDDYLWNMGKFYETSKIGSAITARMNFNFSMLLLQEGHKGINIILLNSIL